jgi:Domain of unknown function (DUF4126)
MEFSSTGLVSVALGVGLAAATGLRVFLPLLAAAIAARADWIPLTDSFAWLESTPALITLSTAAIFETLAYYVPGLDHVLDLLAGPAAVAAGVVVSASVMADVPPAVMWPVAIIAGGGVAGLTKGSAALVRAKAGVATGGLANPVVSTGETLGASALALLAIALPVLGLVLVVLLLWWVMRRAGRILRRRRGASAD